MTELCLVWDSNEPMHSFRYGLFLYAQTTNVWSCVPYRTEDISFAPVHESAQEYRSTLLLPSKAHLYSFFLNLQVDILPWREHGITLVGTEPFEGEK